MQFINSTNKSINVDIESFENKMLQQKERARKNWKGTGDTEDKEILFEATNDIDPTEFLGYEKNESESIVKKILVNNTLVKKINIGDKGVIILNQTPFYGESGGQIGDEGKISNNKFIFKVYTTTKIFGNFFLHSGEVIKGECKINDQVKAKINIEKRSLIRNNHTSTHLLHASLRKILGNHVSQKGSLVNDHKLRFDFSHNETISNIDIEKIERLVNKIIIENHNVNIEIIDHKTAIDSGAIALFGEKYGEEVRVVSICLNKDEIFSKELCGGTHVSNTSEIKKFKITNQSSIASGVKRIEAITNTSVEKFLINEEFQKKNSKSILEKEISKYDELLKNIDPKLKYQIKNEYDLESQLKEIKKIYNNNKQKINIIKNKENIKIEKIGGNTLVYLLAHKYPNKAFKIFIDEQKKLNPNKSIIVLVSIDENKVSIIAGITNDLIHKYDATNIVKVASEIVGGKGGGGRKDLAQAGGSMPKEAEKIYDQIKNQILI